jgi:hypothetical protein
MSTTSKPHDLPNLDLSSTGVTVSTPSDPDTDIVIAGDPVSFNLNLAITGKNSFVGPLLNEPVEVTHHVEQVETGTRTTLGPFTFTTPGTVAGAASFSLTTPVIGSFTTGNSTSGAQFTTAPPSEDDGVYRVVTEFHFTSNAAMTSISVFDDRLLAITAG